MQKYNCCHNGQSGSSGGVGRDMKTTVPAVRACWTQKKQESYCHELYRCFLTSKIQRSPFLMFHFRKRGGDVSSTRYRAPSVKPLEPSPSWIRLNIRLCGEVKGKLDARCRVLPFTFKKWGESKLCSQRRE